MAYQGDDFSLLCPDLIPTALEYLFSISKEFPICNLNRRCTFLIYFYLIIAGIQSYTAYISFRCTTYHFKVFIPHNVITTLILELALETMFYDILFQCFFTVDDLKGFAVGALCIIEYKYGIFVLICICIDFLHHEP